MADEILIVEDSETQALQLTWLLEEAGWEVIRASTGEAALEELNRHLPALIIVDYHLPGIAGDELCRRVRMNVGTRGIPILMLTGDDSSGSEPAGLDSGADGYVSKSVAPEILLLRVRALLRSTGERASGLSPQEAYFHRARILAIDDSPTWLESLVTAFSGEGYEVVTAACAEDGLARIAQEPFDCAMVDLIMPGIDGIETCRLINQMARSMDHPMVVIMLTSSETKEDMTRGLEAGADDFVGKSSDMTVLKARIRALLRRKFFQEENRRIREQLLQTELEASEARAAKELAATRAVLVDELERKNRELEALAGVREESEHKSRFMANMSHELRTPLNSIIGFTEIVHDKRAGEINEMQQEYLGDSLRSARHLLALINDILDLEKIAAGRKDLTLQHFDLHQLVRETVHEVSVMAAANQVRLVVELDDRVRWVYLDRQKTKQILLNLAMNAVKFTPEGGLVTVRARLAGKERWVLEVQDTGIGISEQDQTRLFREFEQLETSASKRFQGTGLGLALTRNLVEAQNGAIAVASSVAVGSTFSAILPTTLARRKPVVEGNENGGANWALDQSPPTLTSFGMAGEDGYILILDDDPSVHKLVKLALRDSGFQVVGCPDGESGLSEIARRLPSAMVVDLLLPNLDGFNFIARLQDIPNARAIPVVVWTNLDLSKQEMEGLLADVRQVIYKRDGGIGRLIRELEKELRVPAMETVGQ